MKKYLIVVMVLYSSTIYAQWNMEIGGTLGLSIPNGELSETYETGFHVEGTVDILTSNPNINLVLGANIMGFKGKTITKSSPGYYSEEDYGTANYVSLFVGPRLSTNMETDNGPKLFILPAIAVNFPDYTHSMDSGSSVYYTPQFDWEFREGVRYGLSLGAGMLIPLGSSHFKINIGLKYAMLNLIGKDENESSTGTFQLMAGLHFK